MISTERDIDLHGVPLDLGGNRRGTDMGPSALRIALLQQRLERLGHRVHDRGDVRVESREMSQMGEPEAKYLKRILRCCERLRRRVYESMLRGHFPLVIGGDHSCAMGTVTGVAQSLRERGQSLGLIWFDAHADMNTPETSPSGNVHGMPLASLLGMGHGEFVDIGGFAPKVKAHNVALIGIRDLDGRERETVANSGVHVFTMKEVDLHGMSRVAEEAIAAVTDGTAGIHLSLDLDGCDPSLAPGVGTPVPGGLNYRETHLLLELLADTQKLISMEVVELNPILDQRNASAEAAVGLIQSALGRSIL